MNFKDNPEYLPVIISKGITFYAPANTTEGYHISRYVAAQAQDIYSKAGATKELLDKMMNTLLDTVNEGKNNTSRIRSDVSLIANNILYRTKHPVDEDCCIRMGAIYTFIDGENPNEVSDLWTRKKMQLAKEDSELYSFFIELGLKSTPSYKEQFHLLLDSDYFQKRAEMLMALTPKPSQTK